MEGINWVARTWTVHIVLLGLVVLCIHIRSSYLVALPTLNSFS